MNLRKKTQPQAAHGSDVENQISKTDDLVPTERPNRRITTVAKNLINFINEMNKETREVRKKKDRKQDMEIQKSQPIKKQKVEKLTPGVVHQPKQPTQKVVQKQDVTKQLPKQDINRYYRYNPGDPFALNEMNQTKKLNMPYGNPFDFLIQNQLKQGMPYYSGMEFLQIPNPYSFPIQNLQNLQAMHGIPPNLQSLHGMMTVNGNKPQYLWHDNRIQMMPQQIPSAPLNINELKNLKQQGKDHKIFNRASYHVAIAYNIHIQKLKKKSQAEQMDQCSLDPTHWARKMRDQNQGDRQVIRQMQPKIPDNKQQ